MLTRTESVVSARHLAYMGAVAWSSNLPLAAGGCMAGKDRMQTLTLQADTSCVASLRYLAKVEERGTPRVAYFGPTSFLRIASAVTLHMAR